MHSKIMLLHPLAASQRFEAISIPPKISDGIALIHVSGLIDSNLIAGLRDSIDAAAADGSIKVIALVINSGGGVVGGVKELADRISMVEKPILSMVSGLGASAAYWIAAATDAIYTTETSEVGGVGVFLSFFDDAQMFEQIGVKVEQFTSGTLKGIGSGGVSLTDDQRIYLQTRVDDLSNIFKSDVRKYRGNISDESLQGQTFLGFEAMNTGLADDIVIDEKDFVATIAAMI